MYLIKELLLQHADGSTPISLRSKGIKPRPPFRDRKQTETSCTIQIWLSLHSAFCASKYNYRTKKRNKRADFESPWMARIIRGSWRWVGFKWSDGARESSDQAQVLGDPGFGASLNDAAGQTLPTLSVWMYTPGTNDRNFLPLLSTITYVFSASCISPEKYYF